jgi:hypothetical protein
MNDTFSNFCPIVYSDNHIQTKRDNILTYDAFHKLIPIFDRYSIFFNVFSQERPQYRS